MLTKSKLQQSINNLPELFTIDQLIDQLIFIEKVEEGLKQSEKGMLISDEDVKLMIDKMVKIEWTKISKEDLKEIYDYIAEDSVRYAFITVNEIYQKVQLIKHNPNLARIVPEINEESIREVISGNYRIVF